MKKITFIKIFFMTLLIFQTLFISVSFSSIQTKDTSVNNKNSYSLANIWEDIQGIGNELYESSSSFVEEAQGLGYELIDHLNNNDWNENWEITKKKSFNDIKLFMSSIENLGKHLFGDGDGNIDLLQSSELVADWAACISGNGKNCTDYLRKASDAISKATNDAFKENGIYYSEEEAKKWMDVIGNANQMIEGASNFIDAVDQMNQSENLSDAFSTLGDAINAVDTMNDSIEGMLSENPESENLPQSSNHLSDGTEGSTNNMNSINNVSNSYGVNNSTPGNLTGNNGTNSSGAPSYGQSGGQIIRQRIERINSPEKQKIDRKVIKRLPPPKRIRVIQ